MKISKRVTLYCVVEYLNHYKLIMDIFLKEEVSYVLYNFEEMFFLIYISLCFLRNTCNDYIVNDTFVCYIIVYSLLKTKFKSTL